MRYSVTWNDHGQPDGWVAILDDEQDIAMAYCREPGAMADAVCAALETSAGVVLRLRWIVPGHGVCCRCALPLTEVPKMLVDLDEGALAKWCSERCQDVDRQEHDLLEQWANDRAAGPMLAAALDAGSREVGGRPVSLTMVAALALIAAAAEMRDPHRTEV